MHNEEAVKRIYEIKHREESKSMLVLIDSPAKLQGYIEILGNGLEFDRADFKAAYHHLFRSKNLAENLVGNDGGIGIRVTEESFSKKLCEVFRGRLYLHRLM